jgi:ClpP class serine protease
MYMRDFFGRLGITFDEVLFSDHANFFSSVHKHTAADSALMAGVLDRIYEEFVSMAAHARHMEYDELEAVARGRIWIGRDALALNLVDELGDFHSAVRVCKQELGMPADEQVSLVDYPHQYTWDQVKKVFSGGADHSQMDTLTSVGRTLLGWTLVHLSEYVGMRTPIGLLLGRLFGACTQLQKPGVHAQMFSGAE